MSLSPDWPFLVSLEEEVDSSESLSPLEEVLLLDELEGRAPSVDVGRVTLLDVRSGGVGSVGAAVVA